MVERLAWVTTRAARGRDDDERIAVAALQRAGVAVDVVDWDDARVDWSRFDRVVPRSCWDYPERLTDFLAWADRVATVSELVNPPDIIRWSVDKQYLAELSAAGVPVTSTDFVPPGSAASFPTGDFVIKPSVGAGSRDAAWYGPAQHEEARAHVTRLHECGAVALVQPHLKSVAAEGEWPIIFLGGEFSHAAGKQVSLPRAGVIDGLFAEETNRPHTPSADQRAVAEAAMAVVRQRLGAPAYGRVDLVRDDDGRFCVLEVELVEPSLFLRYADAAAMSRFVAAVGGKVRH